LDVDKILHNVKRGSLDDSELNERRIEESNPLSDSQSSDQENTDKLDKSIIHLFSQHIEDYKKRENQKRSLKCCFFWIVMLLFVVMIIAPIIIVILLIALRSEMWVIITSLLVGFAEILLAIKTIPEIIAKYLFNRDEDRNHNELMVKVFEQDTLWHESRDNKLKK